jgi:hypothetical protein
MIKYLETSLLPHFIYSNNAQLFNITTFRKLKFSLCLHTESVSVSVSTK